MPRSPRPLPTAACLVALAALACSADAQQIPPAKPAAVQDAPAAAAPAPWMVAYPETKDQPIGMEEADVRAYLDKQLRSDWKKALEKNRNWDRIWSDVFQLMTPAMKVDVAAFALSKYEVTNAQWEKFLEYRTAKVVTAKDDTLAGIATRVWTLDVQQQQADIQRGWRALLRANAGALMPVLNPSNDAKWDPLVARAAETKLPGGIELAHSLFLPPIHWKDGELPAAERRRPIRHVSWEQAEDFCRWAGLRLPTEFEWERAARGPQGRLFPWGDTWEPLRSVHDKFAAAAEAAGRAGVADGVVEVDALPEGANPEGVLHLSGNVSEFTSSRSRKYPGSKCTWRYQRDAVVARGGNYVDRPELMLSADRNAESQQGPLLVSHAVEGYGFRVAASPAGSGADLTAPMAPRYSDLSESDGPALWLPPAAGCAPDDKGAAAYFGFEPWRSAGVIERQLAAESPDHVFVTGPATGLAFLPVRGFPMENVKAPGDLHKCAADPDRLLVLGVLTGTDGVSFTVANATDKDAPKVDVAFDDARFHYPVEERVQTTEHLGAVVTFDGTRALVWTTNSTLKGKAKYREGLLGALEVHPDIRMEKSISAPAAKLQGDLAVLEVSIPLLDRKGQPAAGSPCVRLTLRVPFKRAAKK